VLLGKSDLIVVAATDAEFKVNDKSEFGKAEDSSDMVLSTNVIDCVDFKLLGRLVGTIELDDGSWLEVAKAKRAELSREGVIDVGVDTAPANDSWLKPRLAKLHELLSDFVGNAVENFDC
jgi:hypothetical protein